VIRSLNAAVLFLSGAAALVFQLLWIKQLSLVVGVDVYAVTTGISAFFGGLALGSAVLGRRAEAVASPLRFYATIEIGVAATGVGTTVLLANAAAPFAALESHVMALAWLMPFVLVGVPATLMGGTLPVLLKAAAPDATRVGRTSGLLFAANTAGAIAGCLAAPFLLIPTFGVRGSAVAAACLNVAAAVIASLQSSVPAADESPQPRNERPVKSRQANPAAQDASLALWLYAIAGGIALGYEVVWSLAMAQFVSTRVFAFAIVLATYLAGLTIGSALYSRIADRVRDGWKTFGLLIAAAGVVALVEIALLGPWLMSRQSDAEAAMSAATGSMLAAMCARFLIAAIGFVFVPTLLLGAAFPAAVRLAAGPDRVGRDVGRVVALNTAGGIAGTLVTGFLLVPALGVVRTLGVLGVSATLVGLVAATRAQGSRAASWALLALAVAVAAATPPDRIVSLLTANRGGTLLSYAESAGGTVAVVQQGTGSRTFRRLYIQGVSNSGDVLPSLRYMRLQALLPLLVHNGEPRSALVIGLGTGITAGAMLRDDALTHRVCAELLPAVVQLAPLFHGNYGVTTDSRLDLRVRDGRRDLLRSSDEYDVITLEPPPPSAAGVVNLYSRDFYALARTRLRPHGLLAQWWPLATQNVEDSQSMVRSFLDVFPHASLWTTELHEMLLLGSPDPIELDAARIAARFARPDMATALSDVGVASPAALLATWVTDERGLAQFAGDARAVTDDRPGIEYATWTRTGEFERVLNGLLPLAGDPVLMGAPRDLPLAVLVERRRLVRFYEAGLAAGRGDRDAAMSGVRQVAEEDPENRYYAWFTGQ